MEIKELDSRQKAQYKAKMFEMMQISDREFVPPLSSRTSTTQKSLAGGAPGGDTGAYYDEMLKQNILGAFENGGLLGYVSYKTDYTNDIIGKETLPNIYLSTLISDPAARGRGLTSALYNHLFFAAFPDRSIYTRTWSTNVVHIHILLDKFAFTEKKRIKDDRGKGIDTVYFELKR